MWRQSMTSLLPALAAVLMGVSETALAQPADADGNPYGTGAGAAITLTNSGFNVGGYYRQALVNTTSLLVEASLGAGKDDRETGLSNIYGERIIPDKANYLLMLPLQLGVQRRLFHSQIENNFRPFLQVSGGPTLGWEYPYFEDINGNGEYDAGREPRHDYFGGLLKGEMKAGLGMLIGLGAHFGRSLKRSRGVRIGYRLDYFPGGIQLLEPADHETQQLFLSPVITLTFGRVL